MDRVRRSTFGCFMFDDYVLLGCGGTCFTLKMKALRSFETWVTVCQSTRRDTAGNLILQRCLLSGYWRRVFVTDIRRLTTGIRSEKCVVRRFRRCANVIECIYTNLDSTV